MRITKSYIKNIFNTNNIRQIGYKQLFIVNSKLIVSYKTIIGIVKDNNLYLTKKYYSNTTQRHKYQICILMKNLPIIMVTQEELERLCK